MLEYLVAIFVGLVATYFYRRQKPKNYPPGLPNLPIVGSIPFLENNMLKNVQNLHKKFGPGMQKFFFFRPLSYLAPWYVKVKCFNLIQMVNFVTWSRMVGQFLRSSILDHVYLNDPTVIRNLRSTRPSLLNFNQVIMCRQTTFLTIKGNRTRIGLNSLTNR